MPQARMHRLATAALGSALLIAACGPATPSATVAPSAATSTPAAASPSPTAAPTSAGLSGAWDGALVDPSGSYPAHLSLQDCTSPGTACGELEYLDPSGADTVMCASALTLTAVDGDRYSFSEAYVYRGWGCFQTTFEMTRAADGSLSVDQFGEPGKVCCHGTFTSVPVTAQPSPEVPTTIAGLGRVTASVALGGGSTQYNAVTKDAIWFPVDDLGHVARVDPRTGAVAATIKAGDPGAIDDLRSDPHGVVAGDAGIWVAQAAGKTVGRIDPATNTIVETIALPVVPYVLAIDGTTLWVSSFQDDAVVRVDLATGKLVAQVAVNKPTGIAVGLGAVWVVRHRDDVLVRIDPASNNVAAEISLGARGPNELCGMCVENVIVSDGSIWTANNEGRSVSRIDPKTNKIAATIKLALRAWVVTAGGGSIWASQFDANGDGAFLDKATWGLARIDPATNVSTFIALPDVLNVQWSDDALWVAQVGRRGDTLLRIELQP